MDETLNNTIKIIKHNNNSMFSSIVYILNFINDITLI
jgi:hypothetical protein